MKPITLKRNVKLGNLKYEIAGEDSYRPLNQCLLGVTLMAFIPLIISVIIYFADKIDAIDSFFQAFFVIVLFVILIMIKLWKLK